MNLIAHLKGISYRSIILDPSTIEPEGKSPRHAAGRLKHLALILFALTYLSSAAMPLFAQTQAGNHADLFRGQTLPRTEVARAGFESGLTEVQRLRELQNTISTIVENNMPAVVAVTDGIGFGSGVVISPDGLVLTAGHVMMRDGEYEVAFPDGRTVSARPLGRNLNIDAGMVQITEPGPWPYVELSQREPAPGDWVVALGHSGGM